MKALGAWRKQIGGTVRVLGALAVAGVALSVATPAAKAQVAFGVEVGSGPRYYAPAPVYSGPAYGYEGGSHAYWEHRRYDDWRAQQRRDEAWREHAYWRERRDYDRDRRYEGYGWR